jgi:hypothetical protein
MRSGMHQGVMRRGVICAQEAMRTDCAHDCPPDPHPLPVGTAERSMPACDLFPVSRI